MHVMVAAPEYGRLWGGIGTYLDQLIQATRGRHEFTILGGAMPGSAASNVHVVPLTEGGGVMTNYSRFQIVLRRRMPSLVRDHRPDLLVVHHAQMPDLLVTAPGCPVVVTAHTTILGQARGAFAALRQGSPLDGTERVTLATLPALLPAELVYWRRARHALFVSRAVRGEVEGTYAPPLRTSATVPNGLGIEELAPAPSPRPDRADRYVLLGGRLLGLKGVAVVLRAFSHLRGTGTRLVLAGRGDLERWKAFARSCGLGAQDVEFLGPVPFKDYISLLRGAAAFVIPSYTESCPYSLIEALAVGTPVVATAVGDIPEMVADTGAILVPPGQPEALAEALRRTLGDDGLRARFLEAGRARWRDRFTSARMCDETFAYFERVLAAR